MLSAKSTVPKQDSDASRLSNSMPQSKQFTENPSLKHTHFGGSEDKPQSYRRYAHKDKNYGLSNLERNYTDIDSAPTQDNASESQYSSQSYDNGILESPNARPYYKQEDHDLPVPRYFASENHENDLLYKDIDSNENIFHRDRAEQFPWALRNTPHKLPENSVDNIGVGYIQRQDIPNETQANIDDHVHHYGGITNFMQHLIYKFILQTIH